MPPKPFNPNAYGKSRSQNRPRLNAAASNSGKDCKIREIASSSTTGQLRQAKNPDQVPDAQNLTQGQATSDLANVSSPPAERERRHDEHAARLAQPLGKTALEFTSTKVDSAHEALSERPRKIWKKSLEQLAATSPTRTPTEFQNDTTVNKLDLEPEVGSAEGMPLTTNGSLSRHHKPSEVEVKVKPDSDTQLKHLQDLTLRKIHRQGKNRKIKEEKHNTTSLQDLDLARTPVNPFKPTLSDRPWAQVSPVTEGREGEEYTSTHVKHNDSSQVWETQPAKVYDAELSSKSALQGSDEVSAIQERPFSMQKKDDRPKTSRWATKEELRVENAETDSNAWGSAAPSDATRGTNPADNEYGRLLNKIPAGPEQETLADWDGKLLPAPADWHDRPRFNNNCEGFKKLFNHWLPRYAGDADKPQRFNNGVAYRILTSEQLQNTNDQADGISMVPRCKTINIHNAAEYGIDTEPDNTTKYSTPLHDHDFEDWGKLDPSDLDNVRHGNEKSQDLIDTWLSHLKVSREKSAELGKKPLTESVIDNAEDDGNEVPHDLIRVRPTLNIYLRPATKADLLELTRIYNWHVDNTTRPVETRRITQSDMRQRWEMAIGGKLPFLVAGKKSQKGAKAKASGYDDGEADLYRQAGIPFRQRTYRGPTRIEQLAGFCCLQEFTAADFVEHISSELEVYVDSTCFRMGIGQCLMDKMLEICDRAYIRRTICDFHCARSIRQQYQPGGARDLHKIYIILRKYHIPKAAVISLEAGQRVRNNALAKTQLHETEYERWQKPWLERFGFEVEGILKKVGARNGRYLDLIYLARETSWTPLEGQVPDPCPGYSGNNGVEEDDDDDDHLEY